MSTCMAGHKLGLRHLDHYLEPSYWRIVRSGALVLCSQLKSSWLSSRGPQGEEGLEKPGVQAQNRVPPTQLWGQALLEVLDGDRIPEGGLGNSYPRKQRKGPGPGL